MLGEGLKKSKKRNVLAVLIAFIVALSIFTASNETNAASTYTVDGVTATLSEDGTLTVTGSGELKQELVKKFDYKNKIKKVIIQTGITRIGDQAFEYCINLTSITVPNSVLSIGTGAFWDCDGLSSIIIPNSVKYIAHYAFFSCSNLTSITIPSSVISIGYYTFNSCTSLTSINVDSGNQYYSSINGVLFNKEKTVLERYPPGKSGETYTIPNSVTSIEKYAFDFCKNLTSITIQSSVTSIKEYAFRYCTNLKTITIPSSVTSIRYCAFEYCTNLTSIIIPNSVTSIEALTFSHCTSLTSITILSSVTSIKQKAFWNCKNLKSIYIPNNVTTIAEDAFEWDNDLTIYCKTGSTAYNYARANSISYKTDDVAPSITLSKKYAKIGEEINIIMSDNGSGAYGYQITTSTAQPTNWNTNITTSIFNSFATYTASSDGIKYIWSIDKVGNATYKQIVVDSKGPTISSVTGNPTSWCKSATIKVNASDELSGVSEYSFDGGSTWQKSNAKTYTSNKSGIQIQVKDNVGNITTYESSINITKIDRTVPTISDVSGNSTSITCENVTLKVTATDAESGVSEYSFDGGNTWQTSNTKTFTESKNVQIQVKDKVGNIATYNTTVNVRIDKTKPSIRVMGPSGELQDEDIVETGTQVRVEMYDINGIDGYQVTNNAIQPTTWKKDFNTDDNIEGFKDITLNTEGRNYIWIKDKPGNIECIIIIVEKENKPDYNSPIIMIEGLSNGNLVKLGTTITIQMSDDIELCGWQITNTESYPSNFKSITGTFQKVTHEVTVEGENYIWVKDASGNTTMVDIVVDGTAPVIIIDNEIEDEGNEVNINLKDEISGISGWQATKTSEVPKEWRTDITEDKVIYIVESGTNYIWAKDGVGNISCITITARGKAPTITGVKNGSVYKDTSVLPEIDDEDLEITLKKDGEEIEYTQGDEISGAGNYELTVKNSLGSTTTVKFTIIELASIKVKTNPTLLTYIKNYDSINLTGGVITLVYSDGSEEQLNMMDSGVTVVEFNNTQVGTQTVKISYKGKTTTFKVTVVEATLKSIEVSKLPTKTDYIHNYEQLDLTGGKIQLRYNDATIQEKDMTDKDVTVTGFNNKQVGKNTLTVTYNGKTATFEVNIIETLEDIIEIKEYTVENNMIKGVQPNTTLKNLKNNIIIHNNEYVKILSKDNKELQETDIITTGTKIRVTAYDEVIEYTIIVIGDTTGDGQADIKDILSINKHRLNKVKLENEYLQAGDVNNDGTADIKDILQINKYRLGKINSL